MQEVSEVTISIAVFIKHNIVHACLLSAFLGCFGCFGFVAHILAKRKYLNIPQSSEHPYSQHIENEDAQFFFISSIFFAFF